MPKTARKVNCKCYEEFMEEMLTMRQTFEKKFLRLTNEIINLRREVQYALAKDKTPQCRKRQAAGTDDELSSSSGKRQLRRRIKKNESDEEEEVIEVPFEDDNDEEDEKPLAYQFVEPTVILKPHAVDDDDGQNELLMPMPKAKSTNKTTTNRSLVDYFGKQPSVLPTRPFTTASEFEDWNALFACDEDQREQLRVELLQGGAEEPEKYIKIIWKSLLSDDVSVFFSYRGKGKRNKKAIKEYVFTELFKECFLRRFPQMEEDFFIDRTMRFFNYAQDRMKKLNNTSKKSFERVVMKNTPQTSDDGALDDYNEVVLDGY